ncbi:type II CAAX endopeptidase family protein [Streptomyces sp. ISL-36]|uniref:CPBP family intramembrane glutamic endopeptidase n=1 Tax=Streptomyces sp. ISL-36 TaxID=2819182 RepID=UPI0027E4059F|nr:type II CAAX endopeptidase family protein [Streptomyces sp. ISL-36]
MVAMSVGLVPFVVLSDPVGDALAPLDWDGVSTLSSAPRHALYLGVIVAGIVGLLWLWLRRYEQRALWTVGFFGPRPVRTFAAGFLLAVVLNLAPLAVARICGWGATTAEDLPATWPSIIGGLAVMVLGWTLQGGSEEVVFRGFLSQSIGLRWGLSAAVVIQAVTFSAAHFLVQQDPIALISDFLVALFLVGYVLMAGNLWGACAFHGAWNWSNSVAAVWFTDAPDVVDAIRNLAIPAVAAIVVPLLAQRRGIPRGAPQNTT